MAEVTNGSFNTSKYSTSSSGTIGLNVSWSIKSQNIANNTTTINWTVKSNGTMSSGYYITCYKVIVKINGTKVVNTTSKFNMYGGGKYKKTGTLTITHGTDGTKTVSMSAQANIYWSSDDKAQDGKASYTLKHIDRCALIDSATNFTDESYPTVTFSNPAGLATDLKLRIKWTNTSSVDQYTSWVTLQDDASDSPYTFTSSTLTAANISSMLASAPSSNSLPITFELQSTIDSTDYTQTKSATMEIVDANPTPNGITFQDTNATTVSRTGSNQIIVQKQSTLQIHTATATAKKSASISSYNLNINGNDYTPDGSGNVTFTNPDVAGTYTATVTVTDSRGNTATQAIDIPIQSWTNPTANCTAVRDGNFQNATALTVNGNISPVLNTNTMYISASHRQKDTSVWTSDGTITSGTATYLNPPEGLDNTKEWEIQVLIWDEYTSNDKTEYILTIGKGIPIMFVDRLTRSVAINGIPDANNQLFVGGLIKAKPNETDNGVILPHIYSDTEQIVGYWIDGRPIYEKTIVLSSDISVAANSWNYGCVTISDVSINAIDGQAFYWSASGQVFGLWKFVGIQTNVSDKRKIDLYNSRDAACQVNRLTIQYIKD
jgi:hypothetical protein